MDNRFSYLSVATCLACVIAFAPQAFAQSTPLYSVTKTVVLGAPDHWDFVVFDPASHKVFVAHGDRVTVVDGRTGTILGNVEGLPGGTHGIAIVPGAERGYTDDGRAGTAASFDLDTLKLITTIKADADADAVVFDQTNSHRSQIGFRGCDHRCWRQARNCGRRRQWQAVCQWRRKEGDHPRRHGDQSN